MKIGNTFFDRANMARTSQAIARALERLSTGKRVNGPQDGVADYRTSLSLDSKIRGLSEISKTVNKATGLTLSLSDSITNQISIVQRMREISVQASSSTLTSSARDSLQEELNALLASFDDADNLESLSKIYNIDPADPSFQLLLSEEGGLSSFDLPTLSSGTSIKKEVGNGAFSSTSTNSFGGNISPETHLVDLNGDGYEDLVNGTSNTGYFSAGNGDGTFKAATTFTGRPEAFGDLDGDGNLDFIDYEPNSSFNVYLGNGDGSFQIAGQFEFDPDFFEDSSQYFQLGDLDGDGDLDLVTSHYHGLAYYNHNITTLLNNGDGSFAAATNVFEQPDSSYTFGTRLDLKDLNNDGVLDINFTDNAGTYTLIGNGDGTFNGDVAAGANGTGAEFFDVDGDGSLDLITGGTGQISVSFSDGDGTFSGTTTFFSNLNGTNIELGDFDDDGNIDVLKVNGTDAEILYGDGNGSFSENKTFSFDNSSPGAATIDINNDGFTDIIATDTINQSVVFYEQGRDEFGALSDIQVGSVDEAEDLTRLLDYTLGLLKEKQGDISAIHNRLSQTAVSLVNEIDANSGAKSLIEDTDYALETAELVRNQMLQQAQTAVFAQANVQLQVVLNLLNFNS